MYWALFVSFLQVGLFSFGGGYAALPVIKSLVVTQQGWLTINDYMDLITISQMTPGPIALNAASFTGMKLGGIPGALIATFGCVLPSLVIVLLLAILYTKYQKQKILQYTLNGLRPAVAALIGAAGCSMVITAFFGAENIVLNQLNVKAVVLFAAALLLLRFRKKINPIWVMLASGVAGLFLYGI